MIRFATTVCAIALVLCITGCKRGRADGLMEKKIGLYNDLADAIEKKDAVQAQRIINEWLVITEKIKQLNLTPEELEKLEEKYKPEVEKAEARYHAAAEKDPEFMKKIDSTPAKK